MRAPPVFHRFASTSSRRLVLVALALFVLNVWVRFPGASNPDSDSQYAQLLAGVYDDWHPPVMARWWRVLHPIADGTAPIYVFHLIVWWFAFAFLATTLQRRGRWLAAWTLLLLAAAPPLVALNTAVTKDVGLAATLLAAFAIANAARDERPSTRRTTLLVATLVVLFGYATLVRANAVFAVGPIMLFACRSGSARRTRTLLGSVLIGAALVPISVVVNRQVLGASEGRALRWLQVFDLLGIARLTGADASHCYTPIAWDTSADRCPEVADALGADPRLSLRWIHAIVEHPVAYAAHRVLAFNAMLYLDVPAAPLDRLQRPPDDDGRSPLARFVLDLVRTNLFTSPALISACALSLLLATRRVGGDGEVRRRSDALALSATLYGASFLPFGVGTGLRYFLWPAVAVIVAVVEAFPLWWPTVRRGGPVAWIAMAPLFVTIAIQVVARLAAHDGALLER